MSQHNTSRSEESIFNRITAIVQRVVQDDPAECEKQLRCSHERETVEYEAEAGVRFRECRDCGSIVVLDRD